MTDRVCNWHSDENVHLCDWAHGELSVIASPGAFVVWSVRLGKHPGLRVGGSTLYPAGGESMAGKIDVAKQAAQGHAEAIERFIDGVLEQLRVQNALLREERAAALAREAGLVAALDEIARFHGGTAMSPTSAIAREALAAHRKDAPAAEPPAPSAPDYIGASDPNRTRHCVPAEPPAPSADGELRAPASREAGEEGDGHG